MKRPELLAPAGDPLKLRIALAHGADAVYGGVSHFSLRLRSSKEFDLESFKAGIDHAHSLGKKVYVTINGFPFNSQIKLFSDHIAAMRDLGPDALIVSSPGTVRLARKIAPDMPLHLSTQANVLNRLDAEAYFEMGVKRIIAAREMSLKDLEEIKTALPDLELEIFIHGSMCFAYSGRCLISSLQTGRVANRGSCANDCRFEYELFVQNPESGVLMRLEEREEGSYLFNAKDLNLMSHLNTILQSGVIDSLKIEGRTKSAYYAGAVTRAYRLALEAIARGEGDLSAYEAELATTKNRGFTDGYLIKRPYEKSGEETLHTSQSEGTHQVAAIVREEGDLFDTKERIRPGDRLEVIAPPGERIAPADNPIGTLSEENGRFFVTLRTIQTESGKELTEVHSGNLNPIRLPDRLPPYTFLRRAL